MAAFLFTRQQISPEEDVENLGPYLKRVIWTLAGLAALFLGLRLYCKVWRQRSLFWDDYFLIASWISLVASVSLQTVATTHGLGMHYYDLTVAAKDAVSLWSIAAGFGSILAACWSKTSFAISLLRISDGRTRLFVWFIIVSVNLVFASIGVVQWVQCWPVKKQWHADMKEGWCLADDVVQNFNTFVAAFSGTMDIVLAFLPWTVIWTVAINKREKLGALLAMSLGVFAGIMAFLKISTLYVIGDDNETNVNLFIFGTAEPATSIMAASMPMLRVLFHRPSPRSARMIELSDNGRVVARSSRKSRDAEAFSY